MKNLKKLRESYGLSQQKLADKFNITQQSIYKYENGLAEPDIETMIAMAKFFNTSVDYIVGNVNDKKSDIILEFTTSDITLLRDYKRLPAYSQELFSKLIKEYSKP